MPATIGLNTQIATISSGQSLSPEIDIGAYTLVGIVVPTGWTPANLTFQMTPDGGVTWVEHYNSAGLNTIYVGAAGQYLAIDPTLWRGVNALKVRSGTAGSPVIQTSTVNVTLVLSFKC